MVCVAVAVWPAASVIVHFSVAVPTGRLTVLGRVTAALLSRHVVVHGVASHVVAGAAMLTDAPASDVALYRALLGRVTVGGAVANARGLYLYWPAVLGRLGGALGTKCAWTVNIHTNAAIVDQVVSQGARDGLAVGRAGARHLNGVGHRRACWHRQRVSH
jgi:hypothetical protein